MATTEYEVEIIDEETGEVTTRPSTAVAARGNQVARREMVGGLLRPVAQPEEVLEAQNQVRDLVAKALTAERDYGVIPGTNQPTLLKPGAERINAAYGLAAEYAIVEKEVDHDRPISYVKRSWRWGEQRGQKIWEETPGHSEGLYRYVVECRLVHRASGAIVGQGIGSCSTMESKYIDRPRDLENTVLKMASKRAYIAATLNTHGLSDQFTQDIEDNPEAFGGGGSVQGNGSAPVKPIMEQTLGFGKHKGKTWAEILTEAPDYIEWAIEKMDKLTPADKAELQRALNREDAGEGDPAEFDRLADQVRIIIDDIRALDKEQGAEAQKYADGILFKDGVTKDEIRTLGGKMKARLDSLATHAALVSPISPDPDYGAGQDFSFPEDDSDDLPF